ncbi:No extended memory [Aphelenchoides fujianensis]|nr:No extended memory [Aphelenchoides fujianensis]
MSVPLENFAMSATESSCEQIVRKYSMAIIDQFAPLMEESNRRKISIQKMLEGTAGGLANTFAFQEESPEQLIYQMFKIPNKSQASIGKLIMVLKNYGLQKNDPRLAPMMAQIWAIEKEKEERSCEAKVVKHWKLAREDFMRCIAESMSLISKTLQNDLVIPSWGSFTRIIGEIYEKCRLIDSGEVANYIPQLARINPNLFGVSITSIDGQRCSFGDTKVPFCLQSVSKAFNYAIATSERGSEYVHGFVGQEASGRLFNEICLDANNKPNNPLINSGAIVTCSLLKTGEPLADRFDHMLAKYRRLAGGEYVGFNNGVFLSERATADRNKALAYYMRENSCFPPDTDLMETLDFYFQLCSMEVNCDSVSIMAATLANGGVCPVTGERVLAARSVRDLLSLMSSCGMYDESGQFAFHVGLPAKSGVSGILMVVIPNVLGLALYSPPLNRQGNSVRGLAFCHMLINQFNFHTYDILANSETSVKIDPRKRSYDGQKEQVVSLLFAAKAGDLNTIRRLFMQKANLELVDYDKRSALHLAASEGHAEIIRFLINVAHVKPDPKDRWQRTPLHDARSEGHTECVRLLEKAMTLSERSEDEDGDADSGIVLPLMHNSRGQQSTRSQCSSIPSSDSSDSEAEDENAEEGSNDSDCRSGSSDSLENRPKSADRNAQTKSPVFRRPRRITRPLVMSPLATVVFISLLFLFMITSAR